jgi:hypothetical protein
MLSRKLLLFAGIGTLAVAMLMTAVTSFAEKPTVLAPCSQCHKPEKDLVRGTLVSVSDRFKTINIQVGQKLVWIINYGDDLKISGADKLTSIPKEKEISIRFSGEEKKPHALALAVKPPAKVPPEKLVSIDEMVKLAALGPERGGYILIDSRPKPRFNEGHIPHAISLDNAKYDELKDKVLPQHKDIPVIFYCGGVT